MKLGVFTTLLSSKSLKETCEYLAGIGVQTVEIGCGGFPGKSHADPEKLLKDNGACRELLDTVKGFGLEISALSCHGNPLHPNRETAAKFDSDLKNAVLLAEKLEVSIINTFSGCPGDCDDSKLPNWVTCSWPGDFLEVLDYQWNQKLIPYWTEFVGFSKSHGVSKIAFEPHPGFCVYNPATLLRLREAVGPELGANFDPSHMFWQGIDPVAAIRELGDAIFHFHAKDTKIDRYNCSVNGVLDVKSYGDTSKRSWIFRTVGYGHDAIVWKDIISALKVAGYDHAISIEHEDSLMSTKEGLEKAVAFLKEVIIEENNQGIWWA